MIIYSIDTNIIHHLSRKVLEKDLMGISVKPLAQEQHECHSWTLRIYPVLPLPQTQPSLFRGAHCIRGLYRNSVLRYLVSKNTEYFTQLPFPFCHSRGGDMLDLQQNFPAWAGKFLPDLDLHLCPL